MIAGALAFSLVSIDLGRLDALLAGDVPGGFRPSADARALAKGFIAGINRYVRDTGAASASPSSKSSSDASYSARMSSFFCPIGSGNGAAQPRPYSRRCL